MTAAVRYKPFTEADHRAILRRTNARFVRSLLRYGMRHGLPNKTSRQCLNELQVLMIVREEELALADKICREWGW